MSSFSHIHVFPLLYFSFYSPPVCCLLIIFFIIQLAFCSCNVRGIGNANKREQIFAWLKDKKFNIYLLQESHSGKDRCDARKQVWCKRAISGDYGTFYPSLTHSSIAHAQPSNGARCLIFCRTLRLFPYLMCAGSEDSGETARMRRLA